MESKVPVFNCGKMEHIFLFDGKMYKPEFFSEEAAEAIAKGRFFIKIDGSCGALIRNKEGVFEIYNRYDDSKGKFEGKAPEGYLPLLEGKNTGQYRGHNYYLRLLKRPDEKAPGVKLNKEEKMILSLYKRLDELDLSHLPDFNSIELVGKNFNKTPGVEDNGIALHSDQEIRIAGLHRLKNAQDFLEFFSGFLMGRGDEIYYEGLVIEHEGRWWKIRTEHLVEGKRVKAYDPPRLIGWEKKNEKKSL